MSGAASIVVLPSTIVRDILRGIVRDLRVAGIAKLALVTSSRVIHLDADKELDFLINANLNVFVDYHARRVANGCRSVQRVRALLQGRVDYPQDGRSPAPHHRWIGSAIRHKNAELCDYLMSELPPCGFFNVCAIMASLLTERSDVAMAVCNRVVFQPNLQRNHAVVGVSKLTRDEKMMLAFSLYPDLEQQNATRRTKAVFAGIFDLSVKNLARELTVESCGEAGRQAYLNLFTFLLYNRQCFIYHVSPTTIHIEVPTRQGESLKIFLRTRLMQLDKCLANPCIEFGASAIQDIQHMLETNPGAEYTDNGAIAVLRRQERFAEIINGL